MSNKRITIYDLAKELGISASYISKALNNHPSINENVIKKVKKKAAELNYRHNANAANLRQGYSRTIGVIVPHINESFFSDAIAGIEEVCAANNYSLVICQSHESFKQECNAIDTFIHQNVDCILISVSSETKSAEHLKTIQKNNIELIQFDRCVDEAESYKVVNDNEEAAYIAVKSLISQGYKKIALLGGPKHLPVFKNRKEGYLRAIKEFHLDIPTGFIVHNVLGKQKSTEAAARLLALPEPPDAFFAVSDFQCLGVMQVAESLGILIPDQLGVFGYANETFSEIIKPSLSSVDQKSKEVGRHAATIYFEKILKNKSATQIKTKTEIIASEIIVRNSSSKNMQNKVPDKVKK